MRTSILSFEDMALLFRLKDGILSPFGGLARACCWEKSARTSTERKCFSVRGFVRFVSSSASALPSGSMLTPAFFLLLNSCSVNQFDTAPSVRFLALSNEFSRRVCFSSSRFANSFRLLPSRSSGHQKADWKKGHKLVCYAPTW